MGRSKRRTSGAAKRAERWLGPESPPRARPWAYEELLLERNGDGRGDLDALAADLSLELQELKRMQNDLYDQVVRVAELEGRIQALRHLGPEPRVEEPAEPDEPEREHVPVRSLPSDPALPHAVKRIPSLARCEGFQVESPAGVLGYVEGLRFVSRIDEPDFLEVRGGRFGRELVLIPAEAVDEVDADLERLLVRAAPAGMHGDHPSELVNLLRRALHQE